MRVFLNPGHDPLYDSGAVNDALGLRECDVAADIGERVKLYLELQCSGRRGARHGVAHLRARRQGGKARARDHLADHDVARHDGSRHQGASRAHRASRDHNARRSRRDGVHRPSARGEAAHGKSRRLRARHRAGHHRLRERAFGGLCRICRSMDGTTYRMKHERSRRQRIFALPAASFCSSARSAVKLRTRTFASAASARHSAGGRGPRSIP